MGRSNIFNRAISAYRLFILAGRRHPLILSVLLFLFTSCQPIYCPLTHNTPYFTKGNQLEVGVNAGLGGANANLAYTPLKYFAMQLNGASFPIVITNPKFYTNYAEGAAGFYLPFKSSMLGINAGYGLGSENWRLNPILGHSGYTLDRLRYDSEKYFGQAYLVFKEDSGAIYHTFSLKINRYSNTYFRSIAGADSGGGTELPVSLLNRNPVTVELNYLFKQRISKKIYINIVAGISIGKDVESAGGSAFIFRFGLIFKP